MNETIGVKQVVYECVNDCWALGKLPADNGFGHDQWSTAINLEQTL